MMPRNGEVSFWLRAAGEPGRLRPSLRGVDHADVCIVGAGYSGLWTAYYLKRADASLRVVVLERKFAGFGASGRNGGWLSGLIPGSREHLARLHGRSGVIDMQRAMNEAVDEVIAVAKVEGIDAGIIKGGCLRIAVTAPQVDRLCGSVEADHAWGVADVTLLSKAELDGRIKIPLATAAAYTPHCARIQPATLVRGLALVVERLGVTIHEGTPVTSIQPGEALTAEGRVRAPIVIRATEGFTSGFRGLKRTWLPMNSSMIITEPLPDEVWSRIGWSGCETLGDSAHTYIYAQRTADGRIAMGGRGVPYRYGSRTDTDGRTHTVSVAALSRALWRLLPQTEGTRVEHAWCGVLGVPRDWCATVEFQPRTGLGWAGGYVGHGVASTNLAGRTLRDLILGHDTDLTGLPWVGHRSRKWEPEPLRWLGVRSLYKAYAWADRREAAGLKQTSLLARVADRVTGKP